MLHALTHSHTCTRSMHSPTRTRAHAHTCRHILDFQGGSHGLYLWASPSLSGVTTFLTVLFSDTVQGLVLPVKGTALVCCFLESFSSVTRSFWKVWVIRFVLVRKKTTSPSRRTFQGSPQVWGFASSCKEMKMPRMPQALMDTLYYPFSKKWVLF